MSDTSTSIIQALGRVRVTPQGIWDANTYYFPLDIVVYTGDNNTYICLIGGKNIIPTNTTYWSLLVSGSTHGATVDSKGILRWN